MNKRIQSLAAVIALAQAFYGEWPRQDEINATDDEWKTLKSMRDTIARASDKANDAAGKEIAKAK